VLLPTRKRITARCSLQDDFNSNVAIFNVYKWRHSDVIVIKLAAGTQNWIPYKMYISDFLYSEKIIEWCCFVTYLSSDPRTLATVALQIASQCHLHSASRHHLSVPRHWLVTFGHQAFSVAYPARQSGTLYRTASGTWLSAAAAVSGNYLRRTSSAVTQHTQRSRDAAWLCAVLIDIDFDCIYQSW